MKMSSLKAWLLLGSVAGIGGTAVAQTKGLATRQQQPAAAPTENAPVIPPQSTAAPVIAVPPSPAGGGYASPSYAPDFGGALSGLPGPRKHEERPVSAIVPVRTLAEAVTLAYRTNPQLLSSRAQARAADYRVPEARSAYGPALNVSGAYTITRTRQEVIPGTFLGAQGWTSTASLIANQPVTTFGRNAAAEAGAIATSQFQRDSLRLSEAQILNDVINAYVSVLRDAASVTIARENLDLLGRQFTDNEARFRAHDLTRTDLDQTATRLELARAQLLEAQGQLGVSQKLFLDTVGAPPGDLTAPDLIDVKFGSVAGAYAYAEANSPLIRAAQSREQVSRAAVVAARADNLPRVDLQGSAGYGSVSPYTDRLRSTQIMGQVVLTQPLIDSGLRRARIGEARESNESDWRLLDAALRQTRDAIGSAWDQLASARASLANYRAAIDAAQRAYDGAVLQQKAGDRTTLDVLDLARDLLTVRNNYNVAVANEYLARSALLQAAGMLEGPKIVPGLQGYDADAHAERVFHRADIPLLTPLLAKVDRLTNGDTHRDRPSRDASAERALDAAVQLPPPDPVTAN